MTKGEKIESSILLIVFIFCAVICGYWCYWKLTYSDSTLDTYKASTLTYVEDKVYPIEINVFTNLNKNGKRVVEFKFNSYMDTEIPTLNEETGKYGLKDLYSIGVQFEYNPKKLLTSDEDAKGYTFYQNTYKQGFLWLGDRTTNIELNKAFYYNASFGESFGATKEITRKTNFIFDIDGKLAKLTQFDKRVKVGGSSSARTLYHYFDIFDFFYHLTDNVVDTFENGINSYVFDLSTWFKFELFNEETGKFEKTGDATQINTYVACKVTKTDDGLISADQSLFGIFKNDAEYGTSRVDYWQSFTEYTITEEDLVYTKISANDYRASIDKACIEYLNSFENMKVHLVLDLDSNYLANRNINVVEFSKGFASKLKLSSVTILSDIERTIDTYETIPNLTLENVTINNLGGIVV